MRLSTLTLASIFAGFSIFANASPLAARDGAGIIASVVSETDFCIFLPPSPGETISDWEWAGVAHCTKPIASSPDARLIPQGLIVSAYFVQTATYVQVTGLINPNVYVNASDEGGQFDTRMPKGASCAGYASFVNLIEPTNPDFCIRCCTNSVDCPTGISQAGCNRIVPGNYTGPTVSSSIPATAVTSASASASGSVSGSSFTLPSSISSSSSPSIAPASSASPAITTGGSPPTSRPAILNTPTSTSDAVPRGVAPATSVLFVLSAIIAIVGF